MFKAIGESDKKNMTTPKVPEPSDIRNKYIPKRKPIVAIPMFQGYAASFRESSNRFLLRTGAKVCQGVGAARTSDMNVALEMLKVPPDLTK